MAGMFGYAAFQLLKVLGGTIKSVTAESRYVGDEQSVQPAKAGFTLAFGFPDSKLPENIGVFTFKYRSKAR